MGAPGWGGAGEVKQYGQRGHPVMAGPPDGMKRGASAIPAIAEQRGSTEVDLHLMWKLAKTRDAGKGRSLPFNAEQRGSTDSAFI